MLSTGKTGGYEIVHQTEHSLKKKKETQDRDLKMPFFKVSTHLKCNRSFTLKDDYGGKRLSVSISLWIFSGLYINSWRKNPPPGAVKLLCVNILQCSVHLRRDITMKCFTMHPCLHFASSTTGRKYTHGALRPIIQTKRKRKSR